MFFISWFPLFCCLVAGVFAVRFGAIWLLAWPINAMLHYLRKGRAPQETSPLVVRLPELIATVLLAWAMAWLGYQALFIFAQRKSVEIVKTINPVASALRELGFDPQDALKKLKEDLPRPAGAPAASAGSTPGASPPFADRWKEKFTRSKAAWVGQNSLKDAYIALAEAPDLAQGVEKLAATLAGPEAIKAQDAAGYFQLQNQEAPLPENASIVLRKMKLSCEELALMAKPDAAMQVELLTVYVTRGAEEARLAYRNFTAVWGSIQYLTVMAFYLGIFLWADRYFHLGQRLGLVAGEVARVFPVVTDVVAGGTIIVKNPQGGQHPFSLPLNLYEKARDLPLGDTLATAWWRRRGSEVVTAVEAMPAGSSVETIGFAAKSSLDAILAQIKSQVENIEYRIFGWIAGVIPSLGFIGTVYGIAAALDKSGGLAQAQDMISRSGALNAVTTELGVAFDTTLVALICGIILGAVGWLVERKEMLMLHAIEDAYSKELHP